MQTGQYPETQIRKSGRDSEGEKPRERHKKYNLPQRFVFKLETRQEQHEHLIGKTGQKRCSTVQPGKLWALRVEHIA